MSTILRAQIADGGKKKSQIGILDSAIELKDQAPVVRIV